MAEKLVWVIAYINREQLHRVEEELKKYRYKIQTYIPTVRVLKRKFKGRNEFEFIPMLFNYGFFRIPYDDACNPEYLMELRNRITAIHGWMRDPDQSMRTTMKLKRNNTNFYNAMPAAAIAKDAEVSSLIKNNKNVDIYSAEDINKIAPGDMITLKGYPFDNMVATLVKINTKKREILVELDMGSLAKEVTVSYENVFYTVYQGYDDSVGKDANYNEMEHVSGNSKKLDKMLYQNLNYEE